MKRFISGFTSENENRPKKRDLFSSKVGVIAAAAGSAVGLGNIWKFPYEAGNNGGAAFILLYLFFIITIGLPVMLSEFVIGRKSRSNVHGAFHKLAPGSKWPFVGYIGILAAFMILAFYSVVGGWCIQYVIYAVSGTFTNGTSDEYCFIFNNFITSPIRPIIWQLLFMAISAGIVLAGIKKGIEKYAKILMPLLLVIIIILDIRAVTLKGAMEGLSFLFKPDFSELTGVSVLEALGQAFFSLSLGMGAIITYGSYVNKHDNLSNTAGEVTIADTLIAILAGIAIFPAVFALGIDHDQGPGLVFVTLPEVFQAMPGGFIFSVLFFTLLVVAAITSSISLLEVVVAYFVEEQKMIRRDATIIATALISIFGMICSLSLSSSVKIEFFGKNFFDWLEFVSSNILLPLGGLFIALFVGWKLGKQKVLKELSNEYTINAPFYHVFIFLVKYIAPIAIAIVFLNGIGVLKYILMIFK